MNVDKFAGLEPRQQGVFLIFLKTKCQDFKGEFKNKELITCKINHNPTKLASSLLNEYKHSIIFKMHLFSSSLIYLSNCPCYYVFLSFTSY